MDLANLKWVVSGILRRADKVFDQILELIKNIWIQNMPIIVALIVIFAIIFLAYKASFIFMPEDSGKRKKRCFSVPILILGLFVSTSISAQSKFLKLESDFSLSPDSWAIEEMYKDSLYPEAIDIIDLDSIEMSQKERIYFEIIKAKCLFELNKEEESIEAFNEVYLKNKEERIIIFLLAGNFLTEKRDYEHAEACYMIIENLVRTKEEKLELYSKMRDYYYARSVHYRDGWNEMGSYYQEKINKLKTKS
jgi:tetratricopeptide (TPR) repeat protein